MSGSSRFPVPERPHRVEETIRRSRFITTVARAEDADTARAFIASIREEFPDASHHCWAFVAGAPGSSHSVGMSDDGEPHGTAGRPMLHALMHSEVGEVVAVCTRYYGGVNLGTGGLSRAYGGGVTLALESLPVVQKVTRRAVVLEVDYAHVDGVKRLCTEVDVVVVEEGYGARVRFDLAVAEEEVDALERRVADLTAGSASFEVESYDDDAPPE